MSSEKQLKNEPLFKTEDFILYILNRLAPDKSDKIKLNKIAFFVEFAYLFSKEKSLSDAKYAAIDMGAVIDSYNSILENMQKEGKITIEGYTIRPLKSPEVDVPEETSLFIDPLIKKYSVFNNNELISLSHDTDSWKITTNNEKVMGQIIDKKLALLETFFDENEATAMIDEDKLPVINKEKLIEYEPK